MSFIDLFPVLFEGYFIKLIFLIHSTLMTMECISIDNLDRGTMIIYSNYNILMSVCILMAILVEKNSDILLVSVGFEFLSLVFDIIILFTGLKESGFFAYLFVILLAIFRPLASIMLLRNYSARAGVADPTSGIFEVQVVNQGNNQQQAGYLDIDPATRA